MFGLSGGHLLLLTIIILLLFGAKRLPELGGSLGKGLREFKKGLEGGYDEQKKINQAKSQDNTATNDSSNGEKKDS